jgi:predicted nucleic acid-binding protein
MYFLDTSALIKRYVAEIGSGWVMSLCDPVSGNTILISQATQAEAVAALCRKARLGAISVLERVTSASYIRAGNLCRAHNLRAYDAVQLSCALTARDKLAALGLSPIFVCADAVLLSVAVAEGLGVEDPSSHP